MNIRIRPFFSAFATLLLTIITSPFSTAFAQGTAFTYQGRLLTTNGAASGSYDLTFALFDSASGGTQQGNTVTNLATAVSNGLFTVTLDFSNQYSGADRWLEIGVQTNSGTGFTTLAPRQQLTPTPYAIFAESADAAGISGTIPAANLGGTYNGTVNFNNGADSFDGTFYGMFYGSTFTGGTFTGDFLGNGSGLSGVWLTAGNSGTTPGTQFLGTTDNQPLEVHVDGVRVLRLEPDPRGSNAGNLIGGYPGNAVIQPASGGDVIAGGGYLGGGNLVYSNSSGVFIGAGSGNHIGPNVNDSVIVGGYGNTIQSADSAIGGGYGNAINTNAYVSAIGGGENNVITASWAIVAGGYYNTNAGQVSFIGSGDFNTIQSAYSVIGGGYHNRIETNASESVIGGGFENAANAYSSAIGGGYLNAVNEYYSFIGGGQQNQIESYADHSFIGGGYSNVISGSVGPAMEVIGGGQLNAIQTNSSYAVIPGGFGNLAGGSNSFAAGYLAQATNNGAFVWSDTSSSNAFNSTGNNQFLIRAAGGVGIGTNNPAAALHVVAQGPGTNIALRLDNGGIAVSGAGINTPTAAFVQVANSTNITGFGGPGYITIIYNPLCDNDPNALLFVTHNFNPPGAAGNYETHPFSVYYYSPHWAIYNDDGASITNMSFNVLVVKR